MGAPCLGWHRGPEKNVFCDRVGTDFNVFDCRGSFCELPFLQNAKIRWYSRKPNETSFVKDSLRKPCMYVCIARESPHYFIDFMSEASVDWGRIVVPKPASPVFMISHMNGLEAQISSIFRRFQREEMEFNCGCSIDTPVFLRWKWLKTHWRRVFSGFVAYSKSIKVSRFLFAISTASLYAAENAFVFGSRRLP